MPFPHKISPRDLFTRFFVFLFILVALPHGAFLHPAYAQQIISNAGPGEINTVKDLINRLELAAENRDVNALAFFGSSLPIDEAPIEIQTQISHIATAPAGALVRLWFSVTVQRNPVAVLSKGSQDLWLKRVPNGFALTNKQFFSPPDAIESLTAAAETEYRDARIENKRAIIDLVASRIGGRWIALRRQRWDGEIVSPSLESRAVGTRDFLKNQITTAPMNSALTGHFIMQKGERGWFGVGSAFEVVKKIPSSVDAAASTWRDRIEGEAFIRPDAHRDFGFALGAVGLWNEAADELQKAELLQVGIVGSQKLREAEANRALDPQVLVAKQIQEESNVGLGPEHPTYLINALLREQQTQPSVIGALRLALEYSRVGEDQLANAKVKEAYDLKNRGASRPQDAAWVDLLFEHLRERQQLSKEKPSNTVRSELFTVRVWPGDPGAVGLLAALEEAQHTVYADFGIPMGNTEVLLWRSQNEFARYTTQFTEQGGSEFVAALTLTKLVSTRNGPMVLGEEINAFANPDAPEDLFGTIAHEYGHVAVRQLSRGRMVPVWFNEGIATSVEGGYDGYIARVRRATNAGSLLSMREMQTWNVDGEKAFLAYSQANSIVDYVVRKWGKKAVLDILRQIGRDVPPDDAFRGVLDLSQAQLWNKWVQEGIK
jgi:hypothetical protein